LETTHPEALNYEIALEFWGNSK